jgi:ADP-ribosylglycohydrolase
MALGDAWGYPTEFQSHATILARKPDIPEDLVITDDTQMSIYNTIALANLVKLGLTDLSNLASDVHLQNLVRREFASSHLLFWEDPMNTRAPGKTCMTALSQYAHTKNPVTGAEGATNNSKGCGTVMRSPWLGLLPLGRDTLMALAALQSQTTHGHPMATLSAVVAALTVNDLVYRRGEVNLDPQEPGLFSHARTILGDLSYSKSNLIPEMEEVMGEMELSLRDFEGRWEDFVNAGEDVDINLFYGEGWVADEALYNALAATSLYNKRPVDGIRRLVYTNGDSDSIAAIGGAFLGALNGYKALDVDVVSRLEPEYKLTLQLCVNHYQAAGQVFTH